MAELTVTTAPAAPEIVPPISPFIPLLTAESMSVQTIREWLESICLKHDGVKKAPETKLAEIWNSKLSKFFNGLSSRQKPEVIWVASSGSIEGISVEWLDNPAVRIADVWSAIAFIMSVAATFDPTPRTPDWYVELLIVFAIVIRKVSKESKSRLDVPAVVHILWTENDQPIIQPSLGRTADSLPNTPQVKPVTTTEASQSSQSSLETSDSSRSSASQPIGLGIDVAQPPQPSLEISDTSSAPLAHPRLATRHAMSSIAPSPSPYFKKLKQSREDDIDRALLELDPSIRDGVMDGVKKIQEHFKKDNLGKCAETVPYLCIVCGGLKHRDIYGLSFKPRKLGEKEAEDALSGKLEPLESGNPPDPLHFLHEFGFITACEICCMLMSGINVHYIQYKRNKNLQPYYKHPERKSEVDATPNSSVTVP